MKGFILTPDELMRLYYELSQLGAPCVGAKKEWRFSPQTKEELLTLAFDCVRHDPRLLSVLILFLKDHYSELNPYLLRQALKKNETPQTVGVIGEFAKQLNLDKELFYLFEYLTKGFSRKNNELFFVGLHPIGSLKLQEVAAQSLKEYRKWGFLGIERPIIDLTTKKTIGSYGTSYRIHILKQLLKRNKKVTVSSYLEALHYTISRQQALYDLKHFFPLKLVGIGRGAFWVSRTSYLGHVK